MQKELISSKQAISIIILFIFGSSVVFGANKTAGQDSWISIITATAMAVPIVLVYARIIALFPETDIYDIINTLFGKIIGKFLIILITWYALHLGSLVLYNFASFTQISTMKETPQIPIMIIMLMVTTYLAISGVETFAKWSIIALPIVILIVIFTIILSIKSMHFSNFLPIMEHDPEIILKGASQTFAFPYAETVMFLTLGYSLKKGSNPYRVYLIALLFGALILLVIFIRNLSVMGTQMMEISYFPSYVEARLISIGDFLERIEGTITYNFVLAGIVKITVCLIAAAKGIANIFNTDNYRYILLPTSLIILAVSATLYSNIVESVNFINIYPIYALPFQVLVPLIIWVWAEIKTRRGKKQLISTEGNNTENNQDSNKNDNQDSNQNNNEDINKDSTKNINNDNDKSSDNETNKYDSNNENTKNRSKYQAESQSSKPNE